MPSTPHPTDPAQTAPSRDQVIQGHTYDGIREYDNPMPAWWLWLLWATVAFSIIYVVGITFFDFVNTYEDDLAESTAELEQIRATYQSQSPSFVPDEASLALLVADPANAEKGAQHFAAQCAACHGVQGQGLIGPNLTDDYWVHGGSNVDIFNVISTGVLAKGMPPWEAVFTAEQRAEMVAFIHSIRGTNPPNAKAAEGELFQP